MIYDNGNNPSISYPLWVLLVYKRFWIGFNSSHPLDTPITDRSGLDPLALVSLNYIRTIRYFISAIKFIRYPLQKNPLSRQSENIHISIRT